MLAAAGAGARTAGTNLPATVRSLLAVPASEVVPAGARAAINDIGKKKARS